MSGIGASDCAVANARTAVTAVRVAAKSLTLLGSSDTEFQVVGWSGCWLNVSVKGDGVWEGLPETPLFASASSKVQVSGNLRQVPDLTERPSSGLLACPKFSGRVSPQLAQRARD